MRFNVLLQLYKKKKEIFGNNAYRYISKVLQEAKPIHKAIFLNSKKVKERIQNGEPVDHEQSWRAFKGKNLEKLIQYIITDEVRKLGLEVVSGTKLEKTSGKNLTKQLSQVKRNLLVDYGVYGAHLPDVDMVIFYPESSKVLAVLSSKVTLRERIAQTGYWKIKLLSDEITKHIKVYFITPDEDGTLRIKKPAKKGRAIVEADLDGSYVLSESDIEESEKVKMFDKFIDDLKELIQ